MKGGYGELSEEENVTRPCRLLTERDVLTAGRRKRRH